MTQDSQKIVQAFSHTTYTLRRKVFAFFGKKFHVYDGAGNLVLFSNMKAFKLKEDLRLYTDESKSVEILSIRARSVIDFGAFYDVFDTRSGQKVGTLKRKGFKSMIRDEWSIMNTMDQEVGLIQEDSTALAVLRRFVDFVSLILPQKYNVTVSGRPVAEFKQNFNPFVQKLTVTFLPGAEAIIDRRFALAAAILMIGIEGRQG